MGTYWIVTNTGCNMRCAHCFEEDYTPAKIDIDHIRRFLDKISILSKINIFGGEPTLDMDHLMEIIDLLYNDKNISDIKIFTNGKFDYELYGEKLLKYIDKLSWQISIQTTRKDVVNIKNSVDTLLWIKNNGFAFEINTTILKEEAELMNEMIDFIYENDMFDNWFINANRTESDLDSYVPYLESVVFRIIDYSFKDQSKLFMPKIVNHILNIQASCSVIDEFGVSSYTAMGVDGKMYACHHASNMKPSNHNKKTILDNPVKIDDWNQKYNAKIGMEYLKNMNFMVGCPIDSDSDTCNKAHRLMIKVKDNIREYIKTKISIIRGDK